MSNLTISMQHYIKTIYELSSSCGEKQRIAIARAMLKDAPIIYSSICSATYD